VESDRIFGRHRPRRRFGAYATDEFARQPEAFNPVLKEVDFTAVSMAAWQGPRRRRRVG
jgi:hypothetical protein